MDNTIGLENYEDIMGQATESALQGNLLPLPGGWH